MSLQSHHYAVFRVGVTATSIEGYATIEVFVKTKYEKILLPIKIQVAKGSIKVDPGSLVFTNCFPVRYVLIVTMFLKNQFALQHCFIYLNCEIIFHN
jgi:hypothetical protein